MQNMILLVHVDASLNTDGLVGSQGGKRVLHGLHSHGDPFKMSRTVPSSLGAEAQAMSVVLGFIEWTTLFLQELIHGSFDLRGEPNNVARQEVCRRCAHNSRVFEEDGLCDMLGTFWFAIGRRAHEGQGGSS